jgi:hypothetical protein
VIRPDLQKLLDELQRELRLRDWRVEIAYRPNLAADDGRPVYGLCTPLVDGKMAQILIRDPATPLSPSDPSVEEILIHELVHLHFAPFATSRPAEIAAEEQAVWALTEALHNAKDASRRAHIARAMVALEKRATGRVAPRLATRKREANMDLTMLLAALKAAYASGDIEQIKALIDQVEQMTGAGDADDAGAASAAPPMQDAPPPPPAQAEPPKQAAPMDPAKCAKPAPVAAPAAKPAPARAQDVGHPLMRAMAAIEARLDRQEVASEIEKRGAHLTEAQRAFAMKLTPSGVKEYLATTSAPASAAATATPATSSSTTRRAAPTIGAKRDASSDPNITEVDRRMGLLPQVTQAISRDPRTGGLRISNIATGKVVKAGE